MDANFDKNIGNKNKVSFNGLKSLIHKIKDKKSAEVKHVEGSAQEAMDAQGRAFVNIEATKTSQEKETKEGKELDNDKTVKKENTTQKSIFGVKAYYDPYKEFRDKKEEVLEKLESLDDDIKRDYGAIFRRYANEYNIYFAEHFFDNVEIIEEMFIEPHDFRYIMESIGSKEDAEGKCIFIDGVLKNPKITQICVNDIFYRIDSKENAEGKLNIANKLLENREMLFNGEASTFDLYHIIEATYSNESAEAKWQFMEKLLKDPSISKDKSSKDLINIICGINSKHAIPIAERILKDYENFTDSQGDDFALFFLNNINSEFRASVANKILDTKELSNRKRIIKNAGYILSNINSQEQANAFCKFIDETKDKLPSLNKYDLTAAAKFLELYDVKNINNIPIGKKKDILREFVSSNTELFNTSDTFKEIFPLVPQNMKEYCELLPQLVKSIGIEGKDLKEGEIKEFNNNLNGLSNSLEKLSDEDFNNLEITQNYSKDEFIKDTLGIVSKLDHIERQKVYDYFGFELKQSEHTESGYTIIGYPKNINNGKKLAQIEDENTKRVVEELRKKVIAFSENNDISVSGNSDIADELNGIMKAFPELRTMIGKPQHRTHDFDLMKHSLKVIQNFSKDPEFNKLNDSDKRLMIIAGLFHDITKAEGMVDKTHAKESAFDTSFLVERLDLNQDEEFKLYNLISNHEWLSYANSKIGLEDKKLMDVAYDFRFDNAFDMAMMFTKADLLAVKKNNNDGNRFATEFMDKALEFEPKIRENIEELKKSQPLLPVTKIPKASKINEAITVVNPDGSTNIKGVYKDKKGLVIIKFNEVENWEELGFPKGTVSKGICEETGKFNTGNIHFFAHGLDYPNQLIKFDAFSMSDSDALLSVSYAERPESKYRFFRPQGILLDCDTKYVHGGGETDAGSGCGKNIQEFKDNYISKNAKRHKDRVYISNLIKERLDMTDAEYVKFVEENENKSFLEIEPKETRDEIIKVFAEINSNTRRGDRAYNEMYISNPKAPMAVFAYETGKVRKIGNPIEFLNREEKQHINRRYDDEISNIERTGFLQDYALERDIPFILFGD